MNQVASLLDRPRRYANIDGIKELFMGAMGVGVALIPWVVARIPKGSVWDRPLIAFNALNVLFLLVLFLAFRAIKKHVTYPRTGLVAYRRRDTIVLPLVLTVVFGVPFMVALIVAARSHWGAAPGLFVGFLFAAVYAYWFARVVAWKWAVVAAMTIGSLVIAVLPARLPAHFILALANHPGETSRVSAGFVGALYLNDMLFGALLLISGGISFWLYLRHTQAPAQAGQ